MPAARPPSTDDDLLRLVALDADGLAILSAHVQDAVLRVQDINWLPRKGHFVVGLNRFVWEKAAAGSWRKRDFERRRAALHLARVRKVQSTGIDRRAADAVISLLAIRFELKDAPSGDVVLEFAGDAKIRLSVEVLEAKLTDLGPAWSTPLAPHHILP